MHLASFYGRVETVRLLLENKAPIEAKDRFEKTPLMGAAALPESVPPEFAYAASAKDPVKKMLILQLLLEHGANVNASADGVTAIEAARRRGTPEMVKVLEEAVKSPKPKPAK